MKFKHALATAGVTFTLLTGCKSLPDMPSVPGFGSIDVNRDWVSEPLIKTDSCNSFTMENVTSFINTYYISGQRVQTKNDPSQDALDNYLMSAVLVNRANLCLAEALELDEVIKELKAEKDALTRGTSMSSDEMERHRSYSVAATEAISKKLDEVKEVEPDKREKLAIGISTFMGGTYTFVNTYEKVLEVYKDLNLDRKQTWQSRLIELPTQMGKGRVIYFVYNGMPEIGKVWVDSSKNLYSFSQANDIEVSGDATNMYRQMRQKRSVVEDDVAAQEADAG